LDAGYTFIKKTSPEITIVPLRTFNLRVVGPLRWKERLETADWEDILGFPWVWGAHDCPYYKPLNEIFHTQGTTPSKVAITDEDSIKTLVASGAGLAILIEEAALAAEQEGRMVIWTQDTLPIDLSFAYLRKREHDPVIQAILNGLFIVWNIRNQADKPLSSADQEKSQSFHTD
jgi:DNA-binding transcriptional LysR family regulator